MPHSLTDVLKRTQMHARDLCFYRWN